MHTELSRISVITLTLKIFAIHLKTIQAFIPTKHDKKNPEVIIW